MVSESSEVGILGSCWRGVTRRFGNFEHSACGRMRLLALPREGKFDSGQQDELAAQQGSAHGAIRVSPNNWVVAE